MEDRKAAPVLRARLLRSYVPLRLRSERKCVLRHHTSLSRRPFSIIKIRNYLEDGMNLNISAATFDIGIV